MTVRELIAVLSTMDPDRVVILQKDSEGNGYSPCAGADDNAAYRADTTYSGEVVAPGRKKGVVPCVVLWPVN